MVSHIRRSLLPQLNILVIGAMPSCLDIFAGVDVVFHIHNHLRLLAVDHKFIGAGDARAVEQRIDGKDSRPRLNRLKPERGKVRELFRGIGEGIDSQTTSGKSILIGTVYPARK
ncbi:Uncharacterised protein [Raoultella planticola]|uniref:Uncharacterized protein n=1 Tax=Raoultella planticola TaxID=575 RepID=A0A485CQC9_RAOPL|nr:Uncharacterised protein [Raoultella planticola]